MFVDSHCHLNLLNSNELHLTLDEIIQDAIDNQVTKILSVATKLEEHKNLIKIAQSFAMIKVSTGIHPEHASEVNYNSVTNQLLNCASDPLVVGIGETGLDYYYLNDLVHNTATQYKKKQQQLFVEHINIAKQLKKPLIIHSRQAQQDTINLLTSEQANLASGVIHCFTENWEMAKKALDLGFYISFSGIITFKNNVNHLLEVAKKTPLESILIETDSPFLAPQPFRGKINRPAYIVYVAEKIAALKNITLPEVAERTTQNYNNLFGNL